MTVLPSLAARARRAAGFTLIELMVVLVIIGVLAALIVPNVLDRTDDARATAARTDVHNLMQALKLYKLDNQRFPTAEQGLLALVQRRVVSPGLRGVVGGSRNDDDADPAEMDPAAEPVDVRAHA